MIELPPPMGLLVALGCLSICLGIAIQFIRILQVKQQLKLQLKDIQGQLELVNADNKALQIQYEVTLERVQQQSARCQELQQQASVDREKHDQVQQQLLTISNEYAELKAILDERDKNYALQLAQFEQQKDIFSAQFKSLANDILDSKSQALQETTKTNVSALMTPFQKSIDDFKKEVQDIHHRGATQQGELRQELESLRGLNERITLEAHELSTALKGQKKLQGNWGELILENVLDRSGLVLGTDYDREVSLTTEQGRYRPDAIVYLPQKKHLIIDAKVSLNAYTRYVNAEDEHEQAQALKAHVKAVGDRIQELSDRNYDQLPGLNSPAIVFMFVPIESAFIEALKADETLFMRAVASKVLVATPTTLLTSLHITRQLWRFEDQNKHTALLASKAEQVHKKLNAFLSSFAKIKESLNKATQIYDQAEGQLVSGKGNLVKQVNSFRALAPGIQQALPDYFIDKADLEITMRETVNE